MTIAKNAQDYIAGHQAAIASNPECGTSHYNLAVGLIGMKRYDEAIGELHDALECSPTLAEAYVQLGGICLQRGDLDGCLHYNTMAVKTRPGLSEGYGNIGFVQLQKGNIDEAIKALKRATALNFRFLQGFTTLANAYLMKGLIDDSIETSLKALELAPDFAVVHNNLAIAYIEKGEHDIRMRVNQFEGPWQASMRVRTEGDDITAATGLDWEPVPEE